MGKSSFLGDRLADSITRVITTMRIPEIEITTAKLRFSADGTPTHATAGREHDNDKSISAKIPGKPVPDYGLESTISVNLNEIAEAVRTAQDPRLTDAAAEDPEDEDAPCLSEITSDTFYAPTS